MNNKIFWNLSYRESLGNQYIDTDTPLNKNFIEQMKKNGFNAGIVYNVEQALDLCSLTTCIN